MNKLTFSKGTYCKEILINQTKYIIVNSNTDYWLYNRCFNSCIEKTSLSDYAIECGSEYRLMIDDENVSKSEEFIFVNHHFDLDEDVKMGSKSLSLRYLNNLIGDSVMSEELNQLSNMLNIYSKLVSNDDIVFEAIDLNQKTLPKMLNMFRLIDGFKANSNDYDYDQYIIIQIELIIHSLSVSKRCWIVVEVIELTEKLKRYIDSLSNVRIIVLFTRSSLEFHSNNVYFDNIDLENDELLYERMVLMTNYYDLNDYKQYLLQDYLKLLINK